MPVMPSEKQSSPRRAPALGAPAASRRPALLALGALGALLALGAAEAGAASASASPVIFATDLEDQEPACWTSRPKAGCLGWTGIRDACLNLCVGEKARTGTKSLRVAFAKNEDYGGAYRQASSRHVFTRFHDYYEEGFDFAAGMKIHRLSAFNAAAQKNDFDIILQLKADEPGMNHCGRTDAKWIALTYNGGPVDWGSVEGRFTPVRGRWYLVETEVRLNTPGRKDGEVRVWIDGRVVLQKAGMDLTGTVASPINSVLFGGWYSNAAGGRNPCPDPDGPSIRYVDDPAISTSYIGPVPAASPGPAKGSRTLSFLLPWGGSLRADYGPSDAYGKTTEVQESASGAFALALDGLDTNRTYHYRLRGTLANGLPYVSPDHVLTTSPEAARPRKPAKPKVLARDKHDPIPD